MAVVDFGAPAIKTTIIGAQQNPKIATFQSGFLYGQAPATAASSGATAATSTYFFRGFYPTTGLFQTWSGTSRNTPPPSGNTLVDITITGIICAGNP